MAEFIIDMKLPVTQLFLFISLVLLMNMLPTNVAQLNHNLKWQGGGIWFGNFNLMLAHADESVILDCKLSDPSVPVTFYREGAGRNYNSWEKISSDGQKYSIIGKQQLLIENLIMKSDNGKYKCVAQGINDKKIQLMIKIGGVSNPEPMIRHKSYKIDYLASELVECEARTAKSGKITLEWYKKLNNTQPALLVNNSLIHLTFERTKEGHTVWTSKLMLSNVTEKDDGIYVCMLYVENKIAKPATTIIRVKKPRPPVITRIFDTSKPRHSVTNIFPVIIKNETQSVEIKCSATGHPRPMVSFYFNGDPILIKNSRSIFISNLHFPKDNGTITCKATNAVGMASRNTSLLVQVPPKILKENSNQVSDAVDKDHTIYCIINRGNLLPFIHWEVQPPCEEGNPKCAPQWRPVHLTEFKLSPNDTGRRTNKSQLTISASKKQDFHFRCTATNEVGQDRFVIKYFYKRKDLERRPLSVVPQRRQVNEGKPLTLTCISGAGLFSKISWKKDNATLLEKNITTVSSKESKTVLHISKAVLSDSGVYKCVGNLIRGDQLEETVEVEIRETFGPNVTLKNQTVIATTHATVMLECKVKANPTAQIVWLKDSVLLNDIRPILLSTEQCSTSNNGYYFIRKNRKIQPQNLIICKVDFKMNNGSYTCRANNSLGHGNASAQLLIRVPPKILTKPIESYVPVGGTLNETCIAEGNPTPWVSWERKDNATYKEFVKPSKGRSSLIIHNIQIAQYGIYKCVSKNSEGDDDFEIIIRKPFKTNKIFKDTHQYRQDRVYQITLIAVISGSVIAILLLSCLVLVLYRRKKIYGGFYIFKDPPSPDYFSNLDPSRALIEQTNKLPYDLVWEFPRKRIRLDQRLGSGAFGEVFLAEAIGILAFEPREKIHLRQKPLIGRRRSTRSDSSSSRTGSQNYKHLATKVAVKKLKDGATLEEVKDLISELKILIHIGEHHNIVNLLGACTKGKESELMIILEYAPYGNLLTFLKGRRTIFKPIWEKQCIGMRDEFTILDLVSCAYQIAKGMEYLASRKCVHRDLAARNVLVGEGYVLKIADFGLARDIYKDDRYVKVSGGLLPIKWMAIEAIKDRVFTHQSDVWSFGVLLWELMTLGGSPYPGYPVKELLDFLCAGYRMDQPQHCPAEVYCMMRECWMELPIDRPIFFEIVNRFARIIEGHCEAEYCAHYLDPEHMSCDGYLRPIDCPRSPSDVFLSPPPYTPQTGETYIDNQFFGSEPDYLENRRKRHSDIPEIVDLLEEDSEENSMTNSLSEIKAKNDAKEKEMARSDSETTNDDQTELESDEQSNASSAPHSPLPKPDMFSNKELQMIHSFLDCDKDIDEKESLISNSPHRYVNEHIKLEDIGRTYSNA